MFKPSSPAVLSPADKAQVLISLGLLFVYALRGSLEAVVKVLRHSHIICGIDQNYTQ